MNSTTQSTRVCRVLLMLLAVALVASCGKAVSEPAIPNGADIQSWVDNGAAGKYVLNVVKGQVPDTGKSGLLAQVMTDSNCAPDAANLNHCHNIIEFGNGDRIEVINNHRMARHRCLRPGETVRVNRMQGPWIRLQTQS